MSLKTLEIGALVLPLHARHGLSQRYETLGGRATLRFSDGALLVQRAWAKLRTVIEGEGSVPPGLAGLDTVNAVTLKCVAQRTVSGGTSITLPAARRSDAGHAPRAFAQVGDRAVETAVNIVANVATLTPVAGAELYWVSYYPQLSVICAPVEERADVNGAVYAWSLTAEEV